MNDIRQIALEYSKLSQKSKEQLELLIQLLNINKYTGHIHLDCHKGTIANLIREEY